MDLADDTANNLRRFGGLIWQLRVTRSMSTDEFGRRAGLSAETVAAIEDGQSEFRLEELFAIGCGLGMPLSRIFRIWDACQRLEAPDAVLDS